MPSDDESDPPSGDRPPSVPRRRLLAIGAAGLCGLAGCSGDGEPTTPATGTGGRPTATTTDRPSTAATTATAEPVDATPTTVDGTTGATTTESAPDVRTTGPPTGGVETFDEAVPRFMDRWGVPGAAVAVSKAGDLVFARGYGLAKRGTDRPVRPDSLFRIASITKRLTATAVLDLVEGGELALDDRLVDLVPDLVPPDGPGDARAREVRLRHLLTHTSGWTDAGLGYPMFRSERVAAELDVARPVGADAIVRYALGEGLTYDPGTRYSYSNVGYCMLGRVVEATTGRAYGTGVRRRVWDRVGAPRPRIGGTRLKDRAEGEVHYHGYRRVESVFPDGGRVPRPYGGFCMQAHDANGGWIASPIDLLRFARGLDGRGDGPELLDAGTKARMRARPSIPQWAGTDRYYGMGTIVDVDGAGDPELYWHNGSLPGSYGLLVHFEQRDLTLAALFNARSSDRSLVSFFRDGRATLLEATTAVAEWPDRDLFDRYP